MMNTLLSQLGPMAVLPLDEGVAQAVQATRSPMGDRIFGVVTTLGNAALIWLALAAVFGLFAWRQPDATRQRIYGRTAVGLVLAMASGQVLVEYIIKPLTLRPRPLTLHPDWNYLDLSGLATSFPSGHATWAFSAVPLLWAIDRRYGHGALAFALVMGFSRIYVSAHWVTDVLAGALIGFGIGFLTLWLVQNYPDRP